jgi:CelD/BcsL family acetyltransferase involved in cellulose biosynthesis
MAVRSWDVPTPAFLQEIAARRMGEAQDIRAARTAGRAPPTSAADDLAFDCFEIEDAHHFQEDWQALSAGALAPNVFLTPSYAATAALHAPAAARPQFLAVWKQRADQARPRLIGLAAIDKKRSLIAPGLAVGWRPRHAAMGGPILAADCADEAFDGLLRALRVFRPEAIGFAFARLPREGAVFATLRRRAVELHLPFLESGAHERAALFAGQRAHDILARAQSPKRRKEISRRYHRLCELGEVRFQTAETPETVSAAMEYFLGLEARGWKGQRGTALLQDQGDAAFARAMTRLFARRGACKVYWVALNAKPIAMGVVLSDGPVDFYWKTSFDEEYAQFSPGALLARMLIERQMRRPGLTHTDSCAIADHPMIDRIWPDRLRIADLAICAEPERQRAFESAMARVALWARMRAAAKETLVTLTRRKVS